MNNTEFRSRGTYRNEFPNEDDNQLTLQVDCRSKREVHWLHAEQEIKRRFLGKKVITNLIMEQGRSTAKQTFIDADAISQLKDSSLRYALRFADAAAAVGWTQDGPYGHSAHHVSVVAIDGGVDSQLVSAGYTGIKKGNKDTFVQNLLLAEFDQI